MFNQNQMTKKFKQSYAYYKVYYYCPHCMAEIEETNEYQSDMIIDDKRYCNTCEKYLKFNINKEKYDDRKK